MNSNSDSHAHASETLAEPALLSAGTPLPCRRPMPVQALTARTSASFAGAVFSLAMALPRALVLAPVLIGRGRRA